MKTKALNDQQIYRFIDADAHVVETEDLWSYLEGSDKKFRPQVFQSDPDNKLWVRDGKSTGFEIRPLRWREKGFIGMRITV